jgi:hypothetical protein
LFLLLTIALLVVLRASGSPLVRLSKNVQMKVDMIITTVQPIAKLRGARDPVRTKRTSTASAIMVTMEITINPVFLFSDILTSGSPSIALCGEALKKAFR